MRYLFCALVAFAVLAVGCETTPDHDARDPDQPPRQIFYKTKAANVAKPAWGNPANQPRRDVKLIYDDAVKCYAVDNRERYYYDHDHDRFLRYWDGEWQTTPEYGDRVKWVEAPAEYVSELLRTRYENVPPGNPTQTKGKGR